MPSEFARLNRAISTADLEQAWLDRLEEASRLEGSGRFAAAMAARLYSLEIYLKLRVCLRLNLRNPIKKLEIHDLDALLTFAGLSTALDDLPPDSGLKINWENILEFSQKLNDLRYLPAVRWTEMQSSDLIRWLNDPEEGVMTWLKTQK
jgi:hypothetical protein